MQELLSAVALARQQFIQAATGLTYAQSQFKPTEADWSIVDIVEHMYWAEMGGINGIWKTLEAIQNNKPRWVGEAVHHGLNIEQIIERTWQTKEIVPEVAKPRWGGSVEYWIIALNSCQALLESLSHKLEGQNLEQIIYPHSISGPMNVIQRMEFLRFHLNRHQIQIENIKAHANFPQS